MEKALLDYLYLNSGVNTRDDFEGLRWNQEQLQGLQGAPLFWQYLDIFDKKALESRVERLLEYIYA